MEKENIFEEVPLESRDINELKSHLQIYLLVLGIIGALISGLIALLAPILPERNGESHIPETGAAYIEEVFYIFLAGMAVFVLLAIWIGSGVMIDIYQNRKLKSRTFITKKYVHKGTNYFEFGTQPVKKLPIKQQLFESFSQGDKVVIEYTRFNEHILKLEKIDSSNSD
ncbi:hypothetical protein Q0590_08700 [Rhodocytophaga aerolata]|uniref:Uncharacterized protein n=1 Tax=Rhodocytophaga aerolata TaxID=455078 RepID=A0ABT8R2K4_9BACT|nr:hypothetical protein [Rhodocytophaga aerolata]MDO1446327.1 hypothetical protein [Rhodocytophaga aerolata]